MTTDEATPETSINSFRRYSRSYRGVRISEYGSITGEDDDIETVENVDTSTDNEALLEKHIDRRQLLAQAKGRSFSASVRNSVRNFSRRSFAVLSGGRHCSIRDVGGKAPLSTQVFNLTKNIIGCGVLALPSGVAAFANAPSALVPASVLAVVTGIVFGYYFHLIGRVCNSTFTATYREAWENTIGENGSSLVALIVILKSGLANLIYSMILADSVKSILLSVGIHLSRTTVLLIVTIVILLPLCLLKDLKVLGPFSLVGLGGMLFTGVAIAVRYFDGTYDAERDGRFLDDLPEHLQPSFGTTGIKGSMTPHVLVLATMLFEAFVAHYNAPRYYVELKQNTMGRFGLLVSYSFGISVIFFIFITVFGFLTFGSNCAGNILNNYSPNDVWATVSRIAIAIAMATTYPLGFFGVKDGILDLLMVPIELQTSHNLNALSVILLTIITLMAMFITDLGLVAAIGGGTLATAVVFIFPALMFWKDVQDKEERATVKEKRESRFCLVLMCIGIIMGGIGVWLAIKGE